MSAPSGSRELAWSLSLATARHAAGFGTCAEVTSLAERIVDWPDALQSLRDQGLAGLFTRALGSGELSRTVRDRAAGLSSPAAARSLAQVRLLLRLVGVLESTGIAVLAYKGPVLSLQLYGDLGLRDSVDLDLVVTPERYADARRALIDMGLTASESRSERQERALFRWLGHACFATEAGERVELHWRLAPLQFPFALSPEDALGRAERLNVAGVPMRVMEHGDLVATLAMHGARHLYERVEWLAALARLLLDDVRPAEALIAHAERVRARRMLIVSAGVAIRVLGAPLGEGWRTALTNDPEGDALAQEIAELVVRCGRSGSWPPDGAAQQRLYARLLDSPRDRVRSLLHAALLPTDREWETVRLSDALTPLYLLVRPARLLARYARRALRVEPR